VIIPSTLSHFFLSDNPNEISTKPKVIKAMESIKNPNNNIVYSPPPTVTLCKKEKTV
jgi:hypothetical protein